MYDDDDYAAELAQYRAWRNRQRDETPIEYWDHLDLSEGAWMSAAETEDEAEEQDDDHDQVAES